jgi:hypothetical protein
MEPVTTKNIGDYRIKIYYDSNPGDPRADDNIAKMVCFHGRYKLGDEHDYNHNDYSGWEEMKNAIIKNEDVLHILPLYLYDHSGITISTSSFNDRWDSGQIGFVYVTKKSVREDYGVKRISPKVSEKALKVLEGEVETYDQYLRGDVYGYEVYKVKTCELGHEHEEEMDSCWGYYGKECCMEEAESIVKHYMKENVVTEV